MAESAHRSWSLEEFFEWQEAQVERYELVDGSPLKMRTGVKNVHDDIVVNLLGELREQLGGSSCRPFTGDGGVETRQVKSVAQMLASIAASAIPMA